MDRRQYAAGEFSQYMEGQPQSLSPSDDEELSLFPEGMPPMPVQAQPAPVRPQRMLGVMAPHPVVKRDRDPDTAHLYRGPPPRSAAELESRQREEARIQSARAPAPPIPPQPGAHRPPPPVATGHQQSAPLMPTMQQPAPPKEPEDPRPAWVRTFGEDIIWAPMIRDRVEGPAQYSRWLLAFSSKAQPVFYRRSQLTGAYLLRRSGSAMGLYAIETHPLSATQLLGLLGMPSAANRQFLAAIDTPLTFDAWATNMGLGANFVALQF